MNMKEVKVLCEENKCLHATNLGTTYGALSLEVISGEEMVDLAKSLVTVKGEACDCIVLVKGISTMNNKLEEEILKIEVIELKNVGEAIKPKDEEEALAYLRSLKVLDKWKNCLKVLQAYGKRGSVELIFVTSKEFLSFKKKYFSNLLSPITKAYLGLEVLERLSDVKEDSLERSIRSIIESSFKEYFPLIEVKLKEGCSSGT